MSPAPTKLAYAECIECGAVVGLKKGYVLRRHVSAKVPPNRPRVERVCDSSGTGNWSALDEETSVLALLTWGEDGPPGITDHSAAERAHYLRALEAARLARLGEEAVSDDDHTGTGHWGGSVTVPADDYRALRARVRELEAAARPKGLPVSGDDHTGTGGSSQPTRG